MAQPETAPQAMAEELVEMAFPGAFVARLIVQFLFNERRNGYIEGTCQAFQRRERRKRLAKLNLGQHANRY